MFEIYSQILYLFSQNKRLNFVELEQQLGTGSLKQRMQEGKFDLDLNQLGIWIRWLEKQLGISNVGLHAAYFSDVSHIGPIGHFIQTCKTIREAMSLSLQWLKANDMLFGMEMTEKDSLVRFEYTLHQKARESDPVIIDELVQLMVAGDYMVQNKLLGIEQVPIRQLTFTCQAPADVGYFEKIFGMTPVFGASSNAITFHQQWFDHPIISYNQELFELLKNHLLTGFDTTKEQLGAKIKNDILIAFKALRTITIEDVAEIYALSSRSVQRSLKEENTSFRQLQELAREELSLALLQSEKISVKEVSYLLGYATISGFIKAFKRWQGVSPKEYKNQEKERFQPE